MYRAILVPFSMVTANVFGLITQVALAHVLIPAQYTAFVSWMAVGQFIATFGFEWMRIGTMRYANSADTEVANRRRRALGAYYGLVSITLVAAAACSFLSAVALGLTSVYGTLLLFAVAQGGFEGIQALARAEFRNSSFAGAWLLRSALGMAVSILVAWKTESAEAALFGLSITVMLTSFLFRRGRLTKWSVLLEDKQSARFLFSYGSFAAAASVISSFFIAAVRSAVAHVAAPDAAAALLLGLDLSQKALLIFGLAINITLLQRSIHAMEFLSIEDRSTQLSSQVSVPALFLIGAGSTFLALQKSFSQLIVPIYYQTQYMNGIAGATLASLFLAIRMYSFDPLYVVVGRTRLALIGPVLAIVSSLSAIMVIWHFGVVDVATLSCAVAAASFISLAGSALTVQRLRVIKVPYRDLGLSVISGASIYLVLFRLEFESPWATIIAGIFVSAGLFLAWTATFDLGGLRTIVIDALRGNRIVDS